MQDAGIGTAPHDGRIGMHGAMTHELMGVFRRQREFAPPRPAASHSALMTIHGNRRCPAHHTQLRAPLEQAHLVEMVFQ